MKAKKQPKRRQLTEDEIGRYPELGTYSAAATNFEFLPEPEEAGAEQGSVLDLIGGFIKRDGFTDLDMMIAHVVPGRQVRIGFTLPGKERGSLQTLDCETRNNREFLKYVIVNELKAGTVPHVKKGRDSWRVKPSDFCKVAGAAGGYPGVVVENLKDLDPARATTPTQPTRPRRQVTWYSSADALRYLQTALEKAGNDPLTEDGYRMLLKRGRDGGHIEARPPERPEQYEAKSLKRFIAAQKQKRNEKANRSAIKGRPIRKTAE